MKTDRLYIQHVSVEEMLDELEAVDGLELVEWTGKETARVRHKSVVRVEAVDLQEKVGTVQPAGVPVIDHRIGVEVTAEDSRGNVHVAFVGNSVPLRVIHQDGNATKNEYRTAFADAKDRRIRLMTWLERDMSFTVRGGRIWIPREVSAEGFPAMWEEEEEVSGVTS